MVHRRVLLKDPLKDWNIEIEEGDYYYIVRRKHKSGKYDPTGLAFIKKDRKSVETFMKKFTYPAHLYWTGFEGRNGFHKTEATKEPDPIMETIVKGVEKVASFRERRKK